MSTAAREVYQRYVAQRRPHVFPGFQREAFPGLVRYTPLRPGLDGWVVFTDLETPALDVAITEQLAHFERLRFPFEWKVYDFDRPAGLRDRLARRGFVAGDVEAFMVYPLAQHRSRPARPGVRVERVTSAQGIRDIVAVQHLVWADALPDLEGWLTAAGEARTLYCAYDGAKPVGTGWTDFPPGTEFADLHGGAVLPEYRGRGIYSALFDARADEARLRGYTHLAVDAAPMSRPILLRQGFLFVCETTPFRWKPRDA